MRESRSTAEGRVSRTGGRKRPFRGMDRGDDAGKEAVRAVSRLGGAAEEGRREVGEGLEEGRREVEGVGSAEVVR